MIAAVVLGALLHWLEIALACLGIGAVITAGLVVRRRWREHQALTQGRYVPWIQPQQFPTQQQPELGQGGQHLHLHLGGLSATERAEVMRQLRGRIADRRVLALVKAPASTRSRCASTRRRVLAPMGLRLSAEKTKITHIDEGLDFLGWHIQRHRKRGTDRQYIYTYPSRKAIKAVTARVKTICRRNINQPLQILIRQLNPALRGWCAYFRPGVSAAAFADLARYTQDRFWRWARRKHRRITVKAIRRRYCNGRWWPATTETGLFNPAKVGTTRYRYRGAAIPAPWPASG